VQNLAICYWESERWQHFLTFNFAKMTTVKILSS